MNDDYLEDKIRRLRPAPLPPDLLARLAREPRPLGSNSPRRAIRWAAAALVILATGGTFMTIPRGSGNKVSDVGRPLSIVRQESTLLSTRTLAQRELEGRVWELVEQQWRDDTVCLCSASPVPVRSTVVRPELVWVPAEYH